MNIANQLSSSALVNERLAVVLGMLTLLAAVAILASCRLVPSIMKRLHKEPLQSPFYRSIYGLHSYFWWAFIVLLALHFLAAFMHSGFPVSGDPDAPIHWAVLSLALIAFLSFLMVLFSCRIIFSF
jgi:cytochrome b561